MRWRTKRAAASPAGVPRPRRRAASSVETRARCVASSGTIRIGAPQLTTIRADSGSSQMLNSAEAVMFPWSCAPPMITISGMYSTMRGSLDRHRDVRQRPDRAEDDVAVRREVGLDQPIDRVGRLQGG